MVQWSGTCRSYWIGAFNVDTAYALRPDPGLRRAYADGHAAPTSRRARDNARDLVCPAADRHAGATARARGAVRRAQRLADAQHRFDAQVARSAGGRGADPRRRGGRPDG